MLNTIHIKNFQSHKDSILEFAPGVNAIVGTSDSGKTAIFRAFRWLFCNRPSGDAFRSTWGGDTIVDVDLQEGQVSRVRTDKENLYVLGEHDEFKAMGTEVPEEIKKILNIDDINLQQQLEGPFLLNLSAGEVAQHFNKIARLDKIDSSLQYVQKKIRESEQTIKFGNQQTEKLEEELQNYDYLEQLDKEVVLLEKKQDQYTDLSKKYRMVVILHTDLVDLEKAISIKTPLLTADKLVGTILLHFSNKSGFLRRKQALSDTLQGLTTIDASIDVLQKRTKADQAVQALLAAYENRRQKQKRVQEFDNLLQTIQEVDSDGKEAERRKLQLEKLFEKEMPNVCPLCGTRLK